MKTTAVLAWIAFLITIAGCNERATDTDGDGTADALDCDELDPAIYPGAPETCNGVDDDCDGEIDEDLTDEGQATWYPDADGDGAGDESAPIASCAPPDGYVDVGGDCNDADPAINPDALEDCLDGIDNDCDKLVDESEDEDDDGVTSCDGDCDDTDPNVFPGNPEVCDGVDQDCDTVLDNGFPDDDLDGSAGCVDCDDDDPAIFPGNPEVCDGLDNDCDVLTDNGIDEDGDGFANNCGGSGLVDILVIVDDSCSMADEQNALATNAALLFEDLVATNTDFNVALITTTDAAFQVVVSPRSADAAGEFAAEVPQGNDGNNVEQPFLRAVEALSQKSGWRRPGAGLSLLILSDEDDQSPLLAFGFLASMQRAVVDTAFLKINHISGLATGCQDGESGTAAPAPRLVFAGQATGGDSQSICSLDWDLTSLLPELLPSDCNDDDPTIFTRAPEICDGLDNNCDGESDNDLDGDASTTCDGDCDDTDPLVFPGAMEICDGLDNDCDGTVTGIDADGDGSFVGGDCDLAEELGDCDDTNPTVFPGAAEQCIDGIDNDCDGVTDADLDGVDTDGDLLDQCGGDCDDTNPNIFPGAPEQMADGIDNDCDNLVDTFDPETVAIYPFTPDNTTRGIALQTPIDFCGSSHDLAIMSSNGFVKLSPTGGIFDQTPTVAEVGAFQPFAGLWTDLNPSLGGQIELSVETDRMTVRYNGVPFAANPSGTVDFDVRIGPNETAEVVVRRFGDGVCTGGACGDSVLGVACGPTTAVDLDPTSGMCEPVPTGGGSASAFIVGPSNGFFPFCAAQ
jgi:hypothetical protein